MKNILYFEKEQIEKRFDEEFCYDYFPDNLKQRIKKFILKESSELNKQWNKRRTKWAFKTVNEFNKGIKEGMQKERERIKRCCYPVIDLEKIKL